MASNKNALIRYKTIDKCLRNKGKEWTLEDLIEACSDALYDYEGRNENVSKRTIQLDIQMMRSDKLGYNAPIAVYDKKYYMYADNDYSIMNIPVTDNDLQIMNDALEILRQFKDFSLFSEMDGVLQRLEDSVQSSKKDQNPIIHLEKNDNLKGLKYLDELYQAILKKVVLKITYKSFKANTSSRLTFHPYLLKEFNNRWFVVGKQGKGTAIMTLALDRILLIDYDLHLKFIDMNLDANEYYKNIVGVTVNEGLKIENIVLSIDRFSAPYVITKPFHSSQKLLKENEDGSVEVSLDLRINFELERLLLGFGDGIKVLKPLKLKNRIKNKLGRAFEKYT